MPMRLPSERLLNPLLSESERKDIVLFDVRDVSAGAAIHLHFEDSNSPWRQGVWLATEGLLQVGNVHSPQLLLWTDTSPATVDIEVIETDGLLRLYNIWDSGRGYGDRESQSATSGMIVEETVPGALRYSCNDVGASPAFDKLVFTIAIDSDPRENGDS